MVVQTALLCSLVLVSALQGSWGVQDGGLVHTRQVLAAAVEEPLENDFHAKPPHDKDKPGNLPFDLHGPLGQDDRSGPEPLPLPPLPPRQEPGDPHLRVGGDNATDGSRPQTALSGAPPHLPHPFSGNTDRPVVFAGIPRRCVDLFSRLCNPSGKHKPSFWSFCVFCFRIYGSWKAAEECWGLSPDSEGTRCYCSTNDK
jgi:hypothetical protein